MITKKIKPLRPGHREKKRYILFEVKGGVFNVSDVKKAITESLLEYLGVKGMSEVGMIFLTDQYKENRGVIRVSAKSLESVKAGLTFVKEISGTDVIVKPVLVSGMMNKVKQN